MRLRRFAGLAVLLVGLALAGHVLSRDSALVRINDRVITQADLESYAAVFTDANGQPTLGREYVLLALVNQALAMDEADRLGLFVSERQVNQIVRQARELGVLRDEMSRDGGVGAYRDRLRTKLRFDLVRATVVGDLEATEAEVADFLATHREDYPGQSLDDVQFEIRTILTDAHVTEAWRMWLADERACAKIVVRPDVSLPPESGEFRCRSDTT